MPCLVVKVRSGSPQFETALRKERQLEGIAKAKAEGVYKGRKPSVDVAQVRALKAQGIGPAAIAKTLGIGRASVYRALAHRRFCSILRRSARCDRADLVDRVTPASRWPNLILAVAVRPRGCLSAPALA